MGSIKHTLTGGHTSVVSSLALTDSEDVLFSGGRDGGIIVSHHARVSRGPSDTISFVRNGILTPASNCAAFRVMRRTSHRFPSSRRSRPARAELKEQISMRFRQSLNSSPRQEQPLALCLRLTARPRSPWRTWTRRRRSGLSRTSMLKAKRTLSTRTASRISSATSPTLPLPLQLLLLLLLPRLRLFPAKSFPLSRP